MMIESMKDPRARMKTRLAKKGRRAGFGTENKYPSGKVSKLGFSFTLHWPFIGQPSALPSVVSRRFQEFQGFDPSKDFQD